MKPGTYRDSYYGSILDPIHGDIKLSEIEKWCIGQPIFSRLRKIKQNTFLYYVFPSANHTRFEHSIGVMHVAGRIFDACHENFATGRQKVEKYKKPGPSSFFDLSQLGDKKTALFYQELRLAALLHDLGHGPMSHLFDRFTIDPNPFLEMLKSAPDLKRYYKGFRALVREGKVDHEVVSCLFIFYLLGQLKKTNRNDPEKFSLQAQDMISQLSSERIVRMIEPHFPGLRDEIQDDQGCDYADFFSQIVTAFPIDADRMDYLLRDSYFSGATYGFYDTNRIFASFQAMRQENRVKICFKESGLDSMLRFIQCRSHLYNQVYFHKTNRAANLMLTYSAGSYLSKKRKVLNAVKSFDKFMEFYINTSDEIFIQEIARKRIAETDAEKDSINDLIIRRLFKRVWQAKIVLSGECGALTNEDHGMTSENMKERLNTIKGKVTEINSKLSTLKDRGIIADADFYTNETFKDSVEKSIIIAKKDSIGYKFSSDWLAAGKEFELANMIVCMVRVYVARTFRKPSEFLEYVGVIQSHLANEIKFLEEFEKNCLDEDKIKVAESLIRMLSSTDREKILTKLPTVK